MSHPETEGEIEIDTEADADACATGALRGFATLDDKTECALAEMRRDLDEAKATAQHLVYGEVYALAEKLARAKVRIVELKRELAGARAAAERSAAWPTHRRDHGPAHE